MTRVRQPPTPPSAPTLPEAHFHSGPLRATPPCPSQLPIYSELLANITAQLKHLAPKAKLFWVTSELNGPVLPLSAFSSVLTDLFSMPFPNVC